MRSVYRLSAVGRVGEFKRLFYILEAKERSLTLIPLRRRWAAIQSLFFIIFTIPFLNALFFTSRLFIAAYPAAAMVVGVSFTVLLVLGLLLLYDWSRRLAWRFSRTSDRNLHPEIKNMKQGIFSSTLAIKTEGGEMSLVVQARRRTLMRALDLAGESGVNRET